MSDNILRAISKSEEVRVFIANTKELVEEARTTHETSPVATAALGRTLTAASMMGSMLKGEKDTLTIQIKGDGPIGGITVISDSKSNVRGYVNNAVVDIPLKPNGKLDVSGAIGHGYLNVIKDLGLKEPYNGMIPLETGEVAEDIAHYFLKSEQINSVVGLGVLVDVDYSVSSSGGFIIQAMPRIKDETIDKLENNIAKITSISNLFKEHQNLEGILNILMDGFDMIVTDVISTQYKCTCSRHRIEKALISLGKKELTDIIEEQGQAELVCHFCNNKYQFDKDELTKLLEKSTKKK